MSLLARSIRRLACTPVARFHTRSAVWAEAKSTGGPSGPVVNLNLASAAETLVNKPVHMVTIPAVTGVMGILADHAPVIAQLKPGVVSVHTNDISDVTHRYFVSGGFATVKSDGTTVKVVEAIKLEDLDAAAARKNLDDAQSALAKAASEREKAEAQITIEVNEAILQALEAK